MTSYLIRKITGIPTMALLLASIFLISSAEAAPLDEVYNCAAIDNSDDRLACYDAAVGRLQQAEASGDVRMVTRKDVEAVERDAFGFNLPTLPRLKGIFSIFGEPDDKPTPPKRDALTAPVVSNNGAARTATVMPTRSLAPPVEIESVDQIVHGLRTTKEFGGSKKTRFYLDNGQVWDQVDTRRVRIPRERDGRENTVEIRRAALGSYLLRVNGEGAAVRVRRRR